MIKKNQTVPKKKVIQFKRISLAVHRQTTQQTIIVNQEDINVKGLPKPVVLRNKPTIQKIGKNYIELLPISEIEPMAFRVSSSSKTYTISPRIQKIANIMKKSPIAGIRRIGHDITDD